MHLSDLLSLLGDPVLGDPQTWLLMGGGFSLFGTSGDRDTNQNTVNTTNDTTTTTANSNNVATNTANTLNAALTNNSSYIKNDSLVQNTALQLTDSFNKISNLNLANVGNTTIGASPPIQDYAAFFAAAPQAKVNQTPIDLSRPLLDFNTLSDLNASQLAALGKLSQGVQTGFKDNTAATSGALTAAMGKDAGGLSNTWLAVIAGLALAVGVLLFRRK